MRVDFDYSRPPDENCIVTMGGKEFCQLIAFLDRAMEVDNLQSRFIGATAFSNELIDVIQALAKASVAAKEHNLPLRGNQRAD